MREGLTIAHNEDLAFRNHDWKTSKFNKIVKKVKESSAKFESEQKALRVEKVVGEASQLESGRKDVAQMGKLASFSVMFISVASVFNTGSKLNQKVLQ